MNTLVCYGRPFPTPRLAPAKGTGALVLARRREAVRPVSALPAFPPAAEPAHAEPARLTLGPAPGPSPAARRRALLGPRGEGGRGRGAEPWGKRRRRSCDAVSLFTRGAAGAFGLSQALGSVSVSLPVRGRLRAGG